MDEHHTSLIKEEQEEEEEKSNPRAIQAIMKVEQARREKMKP